VSRPLNPTELKRLHRDWRRRSDLEVALVLDGVQNPFNVGSLFRSAAAYRVSHLWLAAPTPDPSSSKVAKTALGCERLVPWSVSATGVEAVEEARGAGFTVIAIELTDDATPLFELSPGPRTALVLGHEDRGVHKATLERVDHVAFVPQLGRVGSLNVAQAGTVALYELARQRWQHTGG
jgi:tRNA (guanosine-2'-O-)-methyltransferase